MTYEQRKELLGVAERISNQTDEIRKLYIISIFHKPTWTNDIERIMCLLLLANQQLVDIITKDILGEEGANDNETD